MASAAGSRGGFDRALAKVKGVFLQLLTMCLEQDSSSSVGAVALNEFLSWAQLISMPLAVVATLAQNVGAPPPWALRPLLTVLAVVDPDEIRDLLGHAAYIVVLIMSIMWTVMYVALLVGCMWELGKQNPNVPPVALRTLSSIAQLSATVLFEPMMAILMQALACDDDVWYGGMGVECYGTAHSIIAATILPLIPVYFVSSVAVVSVYLDRGVTSKELDAKGHGRSDVVLMMCKLGVTSMLIFGQALPGWIQCAVLLTASVSWLGAFVWWTPFANGLMNALHGGMASSFLWATGCAVIVWASNGAQDPGLLIVLGTVPAGVLGGILSLQRMRAIARADDPKRLTSPHAVFLWVKERIRLSEAVRAVATEGSAAGLGPFFTASLSTTHPVLSGMLETIAKDRMEAAALDAAMEESDDEAEPAHIPTGAEAEVLVGTDIANSIVDAAWEGVAVLERDYPGSGLALVFAAGAHAAAGDDGADFRERRALSAARAVSGAFDIEFFLYDNTASSRSSSKKKPDAGDDAAGSGKSGGQGGAMSAVDTVLFEQHKRNALRAQSEGQTAYLELLTHVESGGLDVGLVHSKLASRLERAVQSAKQEIESLLRINDRSVEGLRLAATVFTDMVGDVRRGRTYATRADDIQEATSKARSKRVDDVRMMSACPPDEAVIPEESNACITASIDPMRMGEIVAANPVARALFGSGLVGANLRVIVPRPIDDMHDTFLRVYAASGSSKLIGKPRYLVGRHAAGHIFPIRLALYELPPAPNDSRPRIMGAVQPVTTPQGFVVLSDHHETGFCVTAACQQTLDVLQSTPAGLEAASLEASELFPALMIGVASMRAGRSPTAGSRSSITPSVSRGSVSSPAAPGLRLPHRRPKRGPASGGALRRAVTVIGAARFWSRSARANLASVTEESDAAGTPGEPRAEQAEDEGGEAASGAESAGNADSEAETDPDSDGSTTPAAGESAAGAKANPKTISARGEGKMSYFRRFAIANAVLRLAKKMQGRKEAPDRKGKAKRRMLGAVRAVATLRSGASRAAGLGGFGPVDGAAATRPSRRGGSPTSSGPRRPRMGSLARGRSRRDMAHAMAGASDADAQRRARKAARDDTHLPAALRSALQTPFRCRLTIPPAERMTAELDPTDIDAGMHASGVPPRLARGSSAQVSLAGLDRESVAVKVRAFLLPKTMGSDVGGIVLSWARVEQPAAKATAKPTGWGKIRKAAAANKALARWTLGTAVAAAANAPVKPSGALAAPKSRPDAKETPSIAASSSVAQGRSIAAIAANVFRQDRSPVLETPAVRIKQSKAATRPGDAAVEPKVARQGESIKVELTAALQSMAARDSGGLRSTRALLWAGTAALILIVAVVLAALATWRSNAAGHAKAVMRLADLIAATSDMALDGSLGAGVSLSAALPPAPGVTPSELAAAHPASIPGLVSGQGSASLQADTYGAWARSVNATHLLARVRQAPAALHAATSRALEAARLANRAFASAMASAPVVSVGAVASHNARGAANAVIGTGGQSGVQGSPLASSLDAAASMLSAGSALRDSLVSEASLLGPPSDAAVLLAMQTNRTVRALRAAADASVLLAKHEHQAAITWQAASAAVVAAATLLVQLLLAAAAARSVYAEEAAILRLLYLLPPPLVAALKGRAEAAVADHKRRLRDGGGGTGADGGAGNDGHDDGASSGESDGVVFGSDTEGSLTGSRNGSFRSLTGPAESRPEAAAGGVIDPVIGRSVVAGAMGVSRPVRRAEARWQEALRAHVTESFAGRTSLVVRVAESAKGGRAEAMVGKGRPGGRLGGRRPLQRRKEVVSVRRMANESHARRRAQQRRSSLEVFMPGLGRLLGPGVRVRDSWCLGGRAAAMAMVPALLAVAWITGAVALHWAGRAAMRDAAVRGLLAARAHADAVAGTVACARQSSTVLPSALQAASAGSAATSFTGVQASLRAILFGGSVPLAPEAALLAVTGLAHESTMLVAGAPASSAAALALSSSACGILWQGAFRGAVPAELCASAAGGVMARGLTTATARVAADCAAVSDAAAYRGVLLSALAADVGAVAAGRGTTYNVSATAARAEAVRVVAESKGASVLGVFEPWYGGATRSLLRDASLGVDAAEAGSAAAQTTLAGAMLGAYAGLLVLFILPRVRWLRRVIRASRLMINVVPGEALLAVPVLGRAVRDLVKAEREVAKAAEASWQSTLWPRLRACAVRCLCCRCKAGGARGGVCCGSTQGGAPHRASSRHAGGGADGLTPKYSMRVMDESELLRSRSGLAGSAAPSMPRRGAGGSVGLSSMSLLSGGAAEAVPVTLLPPSSVGDRGAPGPPPCDVERATSAGASRPPPPKRRQRFASSTHGIEPPPRRRSDPGQGDLDGLLDP